MNQERNSQNKESEYSNLANIEDVQRHLAILAMSWERLSEDQKLEVIPGLGYN